MKGDFSHRLLYGPYERPIFAVGQKANCLVRGRVLIVGESTSGLPWPLCKPAKLTGGGKAGPIVTSELRRALEHESMWAISSAWGISRSSVRRWRKALGIDFRTEGYWKHLSDAAKSHGFSPERQPKYYVRPTGQQLDMARKKAMEARARKSKDAGKLFTPDEDALIGTDTDAAIAEKLGRSMKSIASRRQKLGKPVVRNIQAHADAGRKASANYSRQMYAISWDEVWAASRRAKCTIERLAAWLGTSSNRLRWKSKDGKIRWPLKWIIESGKILNVDTAKLYE
jgi:hypothetical protein